MFRMAIRVAGGVSKHLVQLAKKQLSRDNISCITIFLRDPSELTSCSSGNSMEVHDLEQPASVVDQLWMRHHTSPNEAVGGGRHNGRMDDDDMGPETDVDSVDDILLSPSIAAAKAMVSQAPVWPQERLEKEQQVWLQTLPWSYADAVRKSPPKKQQPAVQEEIKVNVLPQPETPIPPVLEQEMVFGDEQKEVQVEDIQVATEEPMLQDPAVIAKGEEIKNYVGDNDVVVDSGEESEEEWNYIPGKENQKQIQQIQQELNVDDEDMESQLNPNAAEFVPVFIPPSSTAALEKDLSSSPAKGAEQSLENIDVPSVKEFYSEISKRPSELESLNEDSNKSFSEATLNGVDTTGISTKAVYGGDDTLNFLSNSAAPNPGDEDDEAIEISVPLNDTNPFSPTHVPAEPVIVNAADTIQDQMVQDHFSLGFKPFDPMTQSVMEDEGQHEDETSPDVDFMSSGKPDLLSPETNQVPIGGAEANEALEAQTSSSGFDSESGPDDGDHIPAEQCNLAAAAAAVGISFGEDINIEDIVNNTKSMSLIEDSHPIEKIEQTLSPSLSPLPVLTAKEDLEEKEVDELKADLEVKEQVEMDVQEEKITSPLESPVTSKANESMLQFVEEETETPAANIVEPLYLPVQKSGSKDEKVEVSEREILIKGISPQQLFDLVQELQFNQVNKTKEEEPESDSGFEIINASEASNEPNLIENEPLNRQQETVEDSVASNCITSNSVPDLLLQPSETDTDRQASPIGTGTGDIIADLEGAMLDSTPPMEQTMVEVTALVADEREITEQNLEGTKSPLFFEEDKVGHLDLKKSPLPAEPDKNELAETALTENAHELEMFKMPISLLENKEEIIESPQTVVFEEFEKTFSPKEQVLDFYHVDEVKEVVKETNSVEVDKSTEMGESPIEEELCSKSPIFANNIEEKIVSETLIAENEIGKVEIKEQLLSVDVVKEEIKEQPVFAVPTEREEICVLKDISKPFLEDESKAVEEVKDAPPPVDEDKAKYEEGIPLQPTPPSTPAPGVTLQDEGQDLIAAAIAAAGVAVAGAGAAVVAVSAAESSKVEEKVAVVQKKTSATTGVTAVKKIDTSKTPTKPSSVTAKSSPKSGAPTSTATKKPTALTKTTKPAGTAAKPSLASSKNSTPISKVAPTTRPPSAKPSTPTTKTSSISATAKTPPKVRTSTSAKPAPAATAKPLVGASAAKSAKPASQTSSSKPAPITATKKPEPATIKKQATNTTTVKATVTAAKTSAPPKPATANKFSATKPGSAGAGSKSLANKPPTPAAVTAKPNATSTTTAKPAAKTTTTATARTTTAKASVTTKTTTAAKQGTASSAAAKAPISKTKPAAPTAVKKPLANEKNIKDATNNKLSASKQAAAVKKNTEAKAAKPTTNETKIIEPLTQEPTVTTTNGHVENGLSNEESSPVEIAYQQVVQALN
ncbi:uncharacterized protein isoform X3 [Rhodnius prolixus]|uniref:uncharacterized protein isoform X3 n=1 Tax=Rhodnius prolixus TaxID=13249 RepID=UPI003D18F913